MSRPVVRIRGLRQATPPPRAVVLKRKLRPALGDDLAALEQQLAASSLSVTFPATKPRTHNSRNSFDRANRRPRELQEELGATANIGAWVGRGESMVGDKRIVLDVYLGEMEDGADLHANEHSDLRWVNAQEMASLDWPDADIPIIPLVQDLMRSD